MSNELERVWMEAVMAYFILLSWHLSWGGGIEENHKKETQSE
jgi:hypothetical protein